MNNISDRETIDIVAKTVRFVGLELVDGDLRTAEREVRIRDTRNTGTMPTPRVLTVRTAT